MENQCSVCNKQFSKHSNLRNHAEKFHPDQLDEIASNKSFKVEAVCNKCSKNFSKYANLKKHVIKFHPAEVETLTSAKVYSYQCDECKKNFSNRNNYKNHKKIHVGEEKGDRRSALLKCSLCNNYECTSKSILYTHFHQDHDINIVTTILHFSNETEFKHWKSNLEKNTQSLYINQHG